jgi:ATP-binding cassette, subfamily C, bacterial exporter for protease/lipase
MKSAAFMDGEIGQALGRFRTAFLSVGFFSLVMNLMLLVPSLYMLQVYDRVLPSRNETTLAMLTVLVLSLYAISGLLDFVRAAAISRIGAQFDESLSSRTFDAAFQSNLIKPHAHVTQAFSDLSQLRQFFGGSSVFAFFDAPWLPVYLAVIFLFDFWLGMFAVAGTLTLIVLALLNEWITAKPLAAANQASLHATQSAAGTLRNAQAVRSMGMLDAMFLRWNRLHTKSVQQQLKAADWANVIASTTRFVRLSLQSLVLGLGALLVLENMITPGMMIAASILVGRALAPVEQVISVWRQWGSTRDAHRRLGSLLRAQPARVESLALPAPTGLVAVENLSVVPPGGSKAAVDSLSFALTPGDVLGVLGPSGSGKSTLARALVGVWAATAGAVRFDGAELAKWNPHQLGPHVGYLPQSLELFEGTIAENIARFTEADPQKIIAAAAQAGVHELILRLPNGYETQLGDGGTGLSGGQQQRIALARAIYGSPKVLVLDEPNAHLDEAGEQALIQAIQRLRQSGSTVVLITHRSSTLAVANKILVMKEGALQMFGPKEQLIAALAGVQHQPDGKSTTTLKEADHAA